MIQEQQGQLKSSMNAEGEASKDSLSSEHMELVERKQIGKSPLWIIGNRVDGYFVAMGKQRLGDVYNTIEEVEQGIEANMWEVIGNYVLSLLDARDNFIERLKEVAELENKI